MLNVHELRAAITRNGYTQGQVAAMLGMSANTFSSKIKNSSFGIDEADVMIDILQIADPALVFFNRQ